MENYEAVIESEQYRRCTATSTLSDRWAFSRLACRRIRQFSASCVRPVARGGSDRSDDPPPKKKCVVGWENC